MLGVKLRRFYGDLRQKSGDEYKRSSLVNVRAELNRHLISPPYDRKVNLMHDTAFQGANQVFYGLIRTLKQQGLDRTVHKSAVTEADFKKLYSCGILDTNNPVTLQNKVFVEVNLHFCRRGREGLRELKKDSFVKKSDSNGRTYITLGFNELEKNHQGFDKRDYQEEPRMYEQEGDQCPVKSFDLYVSKLHPECRAFFQRPAEKFNGKETWFVNCPVGKNMLAEKMKKLSNKAGLSRVYTNHCLRASSITFLDISGIQAKDICSVSRHRSTDGILPYTSGPTDKKRYEMSSILHDQSHGEVRKRDGVSGELLPALPEGTASCSDVVPSVRQTDQQVVSSQSGCQAVTESCETASDHSYVMTNNQVTSDNRHENLMKSLFAGSVFQSNSAPVFNLSGNFHFHWINTCIRCNFHSPLYMVHFGEWQSCK